jgi:hypothetical protein
MEIRIPELIKEEVVQPIQDEELGTEQFED